MNNIGLYALEGKGGISNYGERFFRLQVSNMILFVSAKM